MLLGFRKIPSEGTRTNVAPDLPVRALEGIRNPGLLSLVIFLDAVCECARLRLSDERKSCS
jgi:hypothetical protein